MIIYIVAGLGFFFGFILGGSLGFNAGACQCEDLQRFKNKMKGLLQ